MSETVQDRYIVAMDDIGKRMSRYIDYQMAPLPVTFNDLDLADWNLSISHTIPREIQRALSVICLHMNRKVHMAFNFDYFFRKRKTSQGHSQSRTQYNGNISETVPDRVVVTIDH